MGRGGTRPYQCGIEFGFSQALSLHDAVGRELEFGADAGVGRVGVRPFGVGGKLDFASLADDVADGGFELFAGGGGPALRAGLAALHVFVIFQRLGERGNFDGVYAGQFVGGGFVGAVEFHQDVGGGLFEQAAAAVKFLAHGIIGELAGIGGVVFLAGAFLDGLYLVDEVVLQSGFLAGDVVFAAGALHGLGGEFSRGSNGGGERGYFGGGNVAAGEGGGVGAFLRGGGQLVGAGQFIEPGLVDVAPAARGWCGCGWRSGCWIGHNQFRVEGWGPGNLAAKERRERKEMELQNWRSGFRQKAG